MIHAGRVVAEELASVVRIHVCQARLDVLRRDGPPDTIIFARERRSGNKGNSYMVDIGFERIDEGDRVIALMRAAQRKAAGS